MKKYTILSIIFLLLSLVAGIYLVKNNQNLENKANESCWATCDCSCGLTFCADPNGRGCQYECLEKCGELSHSGSLIPSTSCTVANVNEKCISAKSGTLDVVNHYKCPGLTSMPPAGCQDNVETLRNVSQVCVDESFCGVQQIDYENCYVSYLKICDSPTSVPQDTPTPTQRPTSTPVPTNAPTSTPVPTNAPTSTPVPTNAPTSTPTMTPTEAYVYQGPSPTRIILPKSGIEFPAQMLTIFGGIITLVGFLILL